MIQTIKKLLDEALFRDVRNNQGVIGRSRKLRLITITETLIIPDITKTNTNDFFIIHCLKK